MSKDRRNFDSISDVMSKTISSSSSLQNSVYVAAGKESCQSHNRNGLVFTGPSGIRDQMVRPGSPTSIGIGIRSSEETQNLQYVYGLSKVDDTSTYFTNIPHKVGEIGWFLCLNDTQSSCVPTKNESDTSAV